MVRAQRCSTAPSHFLQHSASLVGVVYLGHCSSNNAALTPDSF
jgi:hypothetical protein